MTSVLHDKCTAWQVMTSVLHDVQMRVMTSVLHDKCHDKCSVWHLHPEKRPKPACVPNDTKPISENVALYLYTVHHDNYTYNS